MQPKNFYGVILAFQASAKYEALANNTKVGYAYVLRLAGHPDVMGSLQTGALRPALIQQFLDGLSERPAIQRRALVALKSLESWAVVRDLLPRTITAGCETVGGGGAREPWSEDQIMLAENSARSDLARMVTLAGNTGQRGGDLVRMRWGDLETYKGHPGINVTQEKTGKILWVPFTQELIRAMDTWERPKTKDGITKIDDPIVTRLDGSPYTRPMLSDEWWKECRRNAALAPLLASRLSFHGLRASAVIRLRRAGCSEGEIASMVGMSIPMVSRYCRRSEQRDNALAALARLGTSDEQAKVIPFKTNT